jgi:phage tail protein X
MAETYTTKQGETIDVVCWRHYGRTSGTVEAVLVANPDLPLLDVILPMGTVIFMPDIVNTSAATPLVSLWE